LMTAFPFVVSMLMTVSVNPVTASVNVPPTASVLTSCEFTWYLVLCMCL
jgi:hypothetical protein